MTPRTLTEKDGAGGPREIDPGSDNPRMQCEVCAKWMRLHGTKHNNYEGTVERTQIFYGGCAYSNGEHVSGDYVCDDCCHVECSKKAGQPVYEKLKPSAALIARLGDRWPAISRATGDRT